MPSATCNNVNLEYETFGSPKNPTVLLIMGLGAQMIVWPDRFCHLLAEEGYFVVRFDNRDIGLSTKFHDYVPPKIINQLLSNWLGINISAPYNLYHMAQDSIALLDHLERDKAHLVGASMGGMIAQMIAGIYQHRILSLTSIMSSAHNRGLVLPWNLKLGLKLLNMSRRSTTNDLGDRMETIKLISSKTHPPKDKDLHARLHRALQRDNRQCGTRRQLSAIVATKNRKQYTRAVTAPTLIIHGTEDQLIPLKFGKKNASLIPQAEFREIEGMAHDFPVPLVGYLAFLISRHIDKSSKNS
jgi:pimeloyl-ACP methyl ester carboxylesterase